MFQERDATQPTGANNLNPDYPFSSFLRLNAPSPTLGVSERTIYFVDAPAGFGKTHAAIEYIRRHHAKTECNYAMALPHLNLLREVEGRMLAKGLTPVVITNETEDDGEVVKSLRQYLAAAPHRGEVLLLTQQALVLLPTSRRGITGK